MSDDSGYTVGSVTFDKDRLPGDYRGLRETTVAWQDDSSTERLTCTNCASVWRVTGDCPNEWSIDACWQCCYTFEFSGLADHEVGSVELVEEATCEG